MSSGLKEIHKTIIGEITKPSDRDKQKLIGPSAIGDCAFCVGETLALQLPEQYPDVQPDERFSLAAWLGTGAHLNIDHTFDVPGSVHEEKLFIYELEGYGTIKGSCDWFYQGHVFDWKVLGKYSFQQMKMDYLDNPNQIPKTKYRVQQMLYGHGWKLRGEEVKTCNIGAIPKESNNPDDIRFYSEQYNQEVVDKALDRLEKIWKYVRDGRLDELPSEEGCYRCERITFRI